mmetsp:Transcript_65182/g.212333  ORF Transcript_65182/g.212333 Transcript_65182/m.212333 type:complete len:132 (-) Transcript_65182:59-454(-)
MMPDEKCARMHEDVEKKCADFVKRVGSRRSRRSRRSTRSSWNSSRRRSSCFGSGFCDTMGRNTPSIWQMDQNARWCHLDAKEENIPNCGEKQPDWNGIESERLQLAGLGHREEARVAGVCAARVCAVLRRT